MNNDHALPLRSFPFLCNRVRFSPSRSSINLFDARFQPAIVYIAKRSTNPSRMEAKGECWRLGRAAFIPVESGLQSLI
jgi:hypothetical protein